MFVHLLQTKFISLAELLNFCILLENLEILPLAVPDQKGVKKNSYPFPDIDKRFEIILERRIKSFPLFSGHVFPDVFSREFLSSYLLINEPIQRHRCGAPLTFELHNSNGL